MTENNNCLWELLMTEEQIKKLAREIADIEIDEQEYLKFEERLEKMIEQSSKEILRKLGIN